MNASEDMSGRTCVLTGATSGIGRVAAEEIARRGATVTVVGRDKAKTERVVAHIQRATKNDGVDYLLADLSSMGSVRQLSRAVSAKHDALHVLVNNAGAIFTRRHVTVDGYEKTFALNHLAYFLLIRELLPLLEAGAPSRIVNVTSDAHKGGTIDFDDLQAERRFGAWKAYSQSKLANVLFTYELARRLEGKAITANCVHPGFVRTGFGKNDGWWMKLGVTIGGFFGRTPEKGAEGIVHLACSPEVEGISGKYFMDRSERRSNRESHDTAVARRLWKVSEELVG